MNKEEFLKKLEELLSDVDAAERSEAIHYYQEYFQDSEKAEEDVIKELGSPQEVAHSIREELAEKEIVLAGTVAGENAGGESQGAEQSKEAGWQTAGSFSANSDASQQSSSQEKEKKSMEPGIVVLIILAIIFVGIPVGLPLLGSALTLIVGIIGVMLGPVVAGAICFVVFGLAAVICFVVSIMKLVAAPLAGVIILGISLLLLGLCFLSALITWKMCSVVIPACVRGVVYLCRLPFRKNQEATV